MARKYSFYAKYEMSKEERESAYWYALRYNKWKSEYKALADTARAIQYSDMPKGGLSIESPVERAAIRREELQSKIKLIEQTALEASSDLYRYLLFAVTNKRTSFTYLKNVMNIPCDKDTYYEARRRFYYKLSQHI